MRKAKLAMVILAAVLLSLPTVGDAGAIDRIREAWQRRHHRPAAGPTRRYRERSPVRVKKELANGLTVLIEENFGAPVVAVQVWVKVGSADESDREAGISHLIEHMVFKGTAKRGVGQTAQEVESLGGDLNAFTSYDNTTYHITISSRYFERSLDILADLVQNAKFDAQEEEKEKLVILEEIRRGKDAPQSRIYKYLFQEAFKVHPYARPIIGTEETVRSMTRDDVVGFYKKWYTPANMTVVVTGDVEANEVMAAVKKYFGGMSGRSPAANPAAAEPGQEAPRTKIYREDVSVSYMYLAFHIPAFREEDTAALDLLSVILGGGESSRLVYRVRTERRLVDHIWSYAATLRDPGLFMVGCDLDQTKLPIALDAILKQIYILKHEPVADWELQKAKLTLETDGIYARETVDGQARQLGYYFLLTGNPDYEKTYLANVKAVTREDLQRVAAKYFSGQNLSLVTILPQGGIANLARRRRRSRPEGITEEALYRIIEDGERWDRSAEPSLLEEPDPITPPEVPIAEKTPALNEGIRTALAPVKYTLANGIRLIVRENHSVPLVSVRAAFEGGLRRETAELSGVNNFLAETITEGTVHYSAAQLHSMIEARAGAISGFAGRNSFGVVLEVPSPYFRSTLPLFQEVIQYPTFPEEEMDRVRGMIISNIKSQLDQPRSFTFRLFRAELYHEHPYGRDVLGTEPSVQQLSRQDLTDYYQDFAVPSNLVIAVVGDVKAADVKKLFEDMFADWVAEPYRPEPIATEPAPDAPREVIECREEVNQTNIVIGVQGARVTDDAHYSLEVLSSALSGMSGRLFRRLRDQQSLAYSVFAFSEEGLDPGFFGVYIGTAPDKETVSREALLRELAAIRQDPLKPDELQRAQKVLIGDFEIQLQRFRNQAAQYALDELYGLGFQNSDSYAERVNAVTSRSIEDAARRILGNGNYVTAVVRPCSPVTRKDLDEPPTSDPSLAYWEAP